MAHVSVTEVELEVPGDLMRPSMSIEDVAT